VRARVGSWGAGLYTVSMVLFAVFITQVGRSSLRPSSSPWSRRT